MNDREAREDARAPVGGAQDALSGGGRHAGREVALQVLYAIDLGETGPRDAAHARAVKAAEEAARPPRAPRAMRPEPRKRASALEVDAEAVGEGVVGELDPLEASGEAFDRIVEHFDVPRSAREFARALVAGVVARAAELDALVGAHARNWRVERMAAVDRNVLRLGAFELRDTDTAVPVVIDEAVDLARRFGSDSSPAFVNGVLDAIARELRAA